MQGSSFGSTPASTRRTLTVPPPFDLSRTAAPAWWARGRWPNVDWRDGSFYWVGWESSDLGWRSVRQIDECTLEILGESNACKDREWAAAVLGTEVVMPQFADPILSGLALAHSGLRPWCAGSLFAGVVSSVVGQSISVAAAATTERRLFERFNDALEIDGRMYWPPPRPEQLCSSTVEVVRGSGVTTRRAEALVTVAGLFASGAVTESPISGPERRVQVEGLLAVSGIGPWTVRSALLWGIADEDSHPTGDVALLRAAKRHYPAITTLKELDRLSEHWKPFRGWAARLLWLDLLGFDFDRDHGGRPQS